MTHEEAKQVLAVALAATAHADLEDERLALMRQHILPLPFRRTLERVQTYVASHKWCSTLAELLDAADVPAGARSDLARAVREGGELRPSLRALSGWEYVAPDAPPPWGVLEAEAVATGRPLPAPERPALPARDEPVRALASMREALARAADPLPVRRTERPIDGTVLQGDAGALYERAQAVMASYERATARLAAEADALREIRAEAEEALAGGDVPPADLPGIAMRVLRRLAQQEGEGRVAAVEALARALWPELALRELRQFPDDEEPQTVRIVLKRDAA